VAVKKKKNCDLIKNFDEFGDIAINNVGDCLIKFGYWKIIFLISIFGDVSLISGIEPINLVINKIILFKKDQRSKCPKIV